MVRHAQLSPVRGRQRSTDLPRRLTPEERGRIAPLRHPRPGHSESGWLHVYKDGEGRGWKASIKPGTCPLDSARRPNRHVGYAPTPEMAALLVADYLAGRFGPDWPKTVGCRYPAYRIEFDDEHFTFRLTVWEAGHEVRLTPNSTGYGPTRKADPFCLGFATEESARVFLRRYAVERFGVFAKLAFWQWSALPPPGSPLPGRCKPRRRSGLRRVPKAGFRWPKGWCNRAAPGVPIIPGLGDPVASG